MERVPTQRDPGGLARDAEFGQGCPRGKGDHVVVPLVLFDDDFNKIFIVSSAGNRASDGATTYPIEELTPDLRLHKLFIDIVREQA